MKENQHRSRPAALILAAIALTAASCTPNVSERDIKPAPRATVLDIVESAPKPGDILIDARKPSSYKAGHIPGARNLTIADINLDARRRPDLERASRIVVYGQNPGDSLATGMALRLLEAGYGKTRLFRGGVDEWTSTGGALTTQAP